MVSAALAVFALAQSPAGNQQPTTPVIRSAARLVQVSVVVLDKRGQPVSGLSRDDFELWEDGKPQRIDAFTAFMRSAVSGQMAATSGAFSNRGGPQVRSGGTVSVVLLDGLNTRIEDQQNAKQHVVRFLEQLRPDDRVALYTLGGALRVLHDFTRDTSALLAALKKFRGRSASELDGAVAHKEAGTPEDAAIGNWLAESETRVQNFMEQTRALRTLDALEAIAAHLAKLPGRKNLLWVSGGFPFAIGENDLPSQNVLSAEKRQFFGEMERTARALNDANVVLYPVDARGLIGAFTDPNFNQAGAITGRPRRTFGGGSEPVRPTIVSLSDTGPTIETMKVLADRTGGRAFYNANDIQKALRRAVDETRDTYELAFYPTHGRWDGAFHSLRVRVRRSGLEVRHRNGYFAYPDAPPNPDDRNAQINIAMHSPLDATGVGISVKLLPGANGSTAPRAMEIILDAKDLAFHNENGKWVGVIRVLLGRKNADGRLRDAETHTIQLRLMQNSYDRAMREGLLLDGQFRILPGVRELRVVVCDDTTGAIGSLSVPLPAYESSALPSGVSP